MGAGTASVLTSLHPERPPISRFGGFGYRKGQFVFRNSREPRTVQTLLYNLTYPPAPLTNEEWQRIESEHPDLPLVGARAKAEAARFALIERIGPEAPLCACECGEHVRWPGNRNRSRYIYRHYSQSLRGLQLERRGIERNCLQCGKLFYIEPWRIRHANRGWCCSRSCLDTLNRKWNICTAFQRRLVTAQTQSGLPTGRFWKSKGLSERTILDYLQNPDVQPRKVTAERIAPTLDMSLAELEKLCGGFADEKMARLATQHLFTARKTSQTASARAKRSARLRGRTISSQQRARLSESARQRGLGAELAARNRSLRMRAIRSLVRHLERKGRKERPQPTIDNLRLWAPATAERLGLISSAVIAIWLDYLVERGLAPGLSATHIAICARRTAVTQPTWAELVQEIGRYVTGESMRIAHNRWHKRSGVPSCSTP